MKTIEQVLHFENILKVIEAIRGGVPGGILPESMFTGFSKCLGNIGHYTRIESTRQTAQAVMYGAPSKNVQLKGVSKVPVTLIHSFECFQHNPIVSTLLQSEDGGEQKYGVEIVGRQTASLTQRNINLRRAAWYQALTLGKIHFDSEGDLLSSAAGAAITVDFSIPAGNKNQLNALGKGNILAATWSNAATDIISQIKNLQKAAANLTGYQIATAYYGANIPGYVGANTIMKEYIKTSPGWSPKLGQSKIPDGLFNLRWRDASLANYVDKTGTVKFFWADDMVVFAPDVADLGWYDFVEGSYPLPTDVGTLHGDAVAATSDLQTIYGLGGYAQVTHDPVGIKQYSFDTFLPVIAVPKSIFIGTVKF